MMWTVANALLEKGFAYLFVGIYNTIFGVVFYAIVLKIFGEQHYLLLLLMTGVVAITNSYLTQKFLVFKTKGNYLKEYLKFFVVYFFNTVLSLLPSYVLVDICHFKPLVVNIFIVGISTVITFLANNFFAFKVSNKQAAGPSEKT